MLLSFRVFYTLRLLLVCLLVAGTLPVTEAFAAKIVKTHQTRKRRNTAARKGPHRQISEILSVKSEIEDMDSPSVEDPVQPGTKERMLTRKISDMIGTPYRFGGEGKKGIDCSAFIKKVFASLGVSLPRTAKEQYTLGKDVPVKELQKGDLLFFRTYASYASHVGIYLGNKLMAHASSGKKGVTISSLDTPYFQSRYLGARRIENLGQSAAPAEIAELAASL